MKHKIIRFFSLISYLLVGPFGPFFLFVRHSENLKELNIYLQPIDYVLLAMCFGLSMPFTSIWIEYFKDKTWPRWKWIKKITKDDQQSENNDTKM